MSGWFGWGEKKVVEDETEGSTPVEAKMGEENTFYYDEKSESWCNKPPTAADVSCSQSESARGFASRHMVKKRVTHAPFMSQSAGGGKRKTRYAMTPGLQMSSAPGMQMVTQQVEEKIGEQNFRSFSEMRGKIFHYNPKK